MNIKELKDYFTLIPCHTVKSSECNCGKKHIIKVLSGKHIKKFESIPEDIETTLIKFTRNNSYTEIKVPILNKNTVNPKFVIENYFLKSNLGILTGELYNLLIIDVDDVDKFQSITKNIHIPETVKVKSGRGYHLYFKHPENIKFNKTLRIHGSFDIKSNMGYVMSPGSTHLSGIKYTWINSPENYKLQECPKEIIDLAK